MSSSSTNFDVVVARVEALAREYCAERGVRHWKAKYLPYEGSRQQTAMAHRRLQDDGIIEPVSAGFNGASAWRFVKESSAEQAEREGGQRR